MLTVEQRQTISTLKNQGTSIRKIAHLLDISRNTVRKALKELDVPFQETEKRWDSLIPEIKELFQPCKGNAVRIAEILQERYDKPIPYSSLTRIVRELQLRQPPAKRSGSYEFAPGQETQHDTSPHQVLLRGKLVKVQCAALVLAFSRKAFIQYYPRFTRFEVKVFLREAFSFMDGACPRCTIDNTSVLVAGGSGAQAVIVPEMQAFGRIYGVTFVPHEVRDPNRKAIVEVLFRYVENNFLAGRDFRDWQDLNEQAVSWCRQVANLKYKRSLGQSPEEAFVMEKSYLQPLPPFLPPVYQTLYRVVDLYGFVSVDTNRYSVPEALVGKTLEVHKHWDRVLVLHRNTVVAEHPRLLDQTNAKHRLPGHHQHIKRKARQPNKEEKVLTGINSTLDQYVALLKKHRQGRRKLQHLLAIKRRYPAQAFDQALERALTFRMLDLRRLEDMILSYVAGDFFHMED
jgi:transposase